MYGHPGPYDKPGFYPIVEADPAREQGRADGFTVAGLIDEHWNEIELDLQDIGVDVGDDRLMRARSWRWLRTRILGLLSRPGSYDAMSGAVRYPNRLCEAMAGPDDQPPLTDAEEG